MTPYSEKEERIPALNKAIGGVVSTLIPTPKEFILRESSHNIKKAKLLYCGMWPEGLGEAGIYHLHLFIHDGGETHHMREELQLSEDFKDVVLIGSRTKEKMVVTAPDIYHSLKKNYDFAAAYSTFHQNWARGNLKPKVAFTLINSSVRGGGTINVFNYVNWLYELGVDVAVYSDDEPPDWIEVKGRFYCIEDPRERYSAITEPVIIVYSVLQLQDLLYFCHTKNKVIYHLCQGIEECHYCASTYASLVASKPIFDFLFSLPVGRLATSPHIRDYFQENYGQKTHNIFNGIDLDFFTPQPKDTFGKDISILSSGNPSHPLKGKADIRKALDLIAKAHTDLSFYLTVVSGEKKLHKDCFVSDAGNFTCETNYYFGTGPSSFTCKVKYGLSQEQMRQTYYSSDIYINASWYEGFGLPSLEAMACGIPVIQADNQGLNGIVVDKKNCLLIPPNNPRKMAEAIEILIKNHKLRECIIKNGIETASRFSLKNQYGMFVKEFEKILNCKFDKTLTGAKKHEPDFKRAESKSNQSYKPLFSVLVPTYNQSKYLPQALDSLIKQTYDNWEAVVINDGSTDDTTEVMKSYAEKEPRIRILHKENGGVASALNEGLRNARGEWICWLSSDDLFEPDKLKTHVEFIEEKPNIRVFHTHYSVLYERTGSKGPAKLDLKTFIPTEELQVLKFFEINYFNGISVAIHREVFDEVGHFNEEYSAGQDFDMWLRISALYRSYFINKRTCVTRIHAAQGTDISPETGSYDSTGIYDSARACFEFLNSNEFPALFPLLDLSVTEQALLAVKNTVRIVINPSSFINRCGYGPALIDRLHEWLTNSASRQLKSLFRPQIAQMINSVQKANLSEEIKTAFQAMQEFLEKPFRYRSYEPLSEMKQHADRLEQTGEIKRASFVKQYLSKISQQTNKHISASDRLFFTVLVPTHNQAKYLPEALDSLINQTYDNWEAVVVNDGSTDDTTEVMQRYARKDRRIRIFHKKNGGVASALNEGLRNARGEWICWLSSDDLFEPDKLEIHLQAITKHSEIKFFYTHFYYFDDETGVKSRPRLWHPIPEPEFQVLRFFMAAYIHGNSVAIHRSVFDRVGLYNETYRQGQDFDMWLRISAHYRTHFIDQRTCVTRWHASQTTNDFPEGGFYESCRACIEFLNSHKFSECFPLIDLINPGITVKVLKETLSTALYLDSMMYKCCFNTSLLERLGEWFSQDCPENLKQFLTSNLDDMINSALESSLPEEIKAALVKLQKSKGDDFRFRPHDFLKETAQHTKKLFSAGKLKEAKSLERYVSHIGSGEEETGIYSNLKYWQQLQDNGYFEKHPHYGELKEYGGDYKLISKYIALSKEMDVVVIGCGYGRETLLIAPHVKHVYGIDVNRTILDKADKFLAEKGITNFTSVLADEWKDVVPSNIALVYSIIVFQHITRDLVKDYIRGLAKKLSPDGKFLCQFGELAFGTYDAELRPYEPNVRWSKTEIEELIEECGLTKNSIDTQEMYGQGNWHWAFFGKQGAKLSQTKILFYFDRLGNSNSSPAGTVIAILNFARAILRERPDVTIHLAGNLVHHPEQFESFQIVPLPLPNKRDKFIAEYDVVFFATHIRYFKDLAKPAGQLWVLYQHCWEADDPISLAHMNDFDAVICLSELHKACLCSQGIRAEKLVTIPNLIDTDTYWPRDIGRNNRSIMFAGGLHPHKCINILLDAFRLVRQQVPEAELHIYGDGAMWRGGDAYGNRLKRIKSEGVYFHGYVDNKDMPQIYSKHSILCLPSRLESFGLVTVEAQACGCIPVVHNVGGVAATLADGQTGLLYRPNTAEKLADAIVKAITVVDKDSSVRQNAVDFVRDNFSMTRAAQYISKLWDRLAIAREINAVKALFESNNIEKASTSCKQLLQKYPDEPDSLLLQALIMLRKGDNEKCKSVLLGLVERFGNHQMALNNLGVLFMNEGKSGEALEYFVKAYNVNICDKNTSLNCSTAWKICAKYKEARMVLFNYLIKVGEYAKVLQLLEEVNNLIVGKVSGDSVVSQMEKSASEHRGGAGLRVMPYCELATNDPLVSVIMPVYNCGRYIGEAIESVLIQTYPKFELIIVDDGSTDNTREGILRYDDERIMYIYQENKGPSSARNRAIKQAKGQYIMPLDADDMMVPYFITSHLKEFERYPEADLVYCDVLLIDASGNPIRIMNKSEYQDRRYLIRDLFRSGHPIIPFRLGIRRSVFDKIGPYDETLVIAEDYDMLRRFVKAGLKAHHLREALHIRRMQSDNISRTANIDKARSHFDVVKRFTDTFRYDELFPDVEWDNIPLEGRQLHAKCLAAATCLALGQAYIKSNLPIYAQTAFGQAKSELNDCLKMDPGNQQVQQLLRKCEFAWVGHAEAVQQAVH